MIRVDSFQLLSHGNGRQGEVLYVVRTVHLPATPIIVLLLHLLFRLTSALGYRS
jgi:hypothetical protein